MLKPLCLVDLDDTLFQTRRKMTGLLQAPPSRIGALDRQSQPRSFLNEEQAHFVDWLSHSTELIPVTARDTEELSRVTLPFDSWQISTHGAVLLTPDGEYDSRWQSQICTALKAYEQDLFGRKVALEAAIEQAGIDAWVRLVREYQQQPIYLVAKHRDSKKIDQLYALADQFDAQHGLAGYYQHRNSNNVAWLPECIGKGRASTELLRRLRKQQPKRPVMGLGDSLTDHYFLRQCSWFGMPRQSQLADCLWQALEESP